MSLALNAMEAHPCHDGADKVDVEYGINVDQMKDHGRGQKAEARKSRHLWPRNLLLSWKKGVCASVLCVTSSCTLSSS